MDWQFALDPGYSVVFAPGQDQAQRLSSVATAMFYPDSHLPQLEEWTGPTTGEAGASFDLGGDSFHVTLNFEARRIELRRLDKSTGQYEPLCIGSDSVARRLRAEGLPDVESFRVFCTQGIDPLEGNAAYVEECVEEETSPPPSEEELAGARARMAVLSADRDSLARLEREHKGAFDWLESQTPLAEFHEDSEAHITQYCEREAELDRCREQIRQKRRELLDQRAKLAKVPQRYPLPAGISTAIGGVGAALIPLGNPFALPIAVLGGLGASFFMFMRYLGTRKQRSVETAIAALRVRERTAERHFSSNAGPVLALLEEVGLDSVENLKRRLVDYEKGAKRLKQLHEQAVEAREAFPAEALAELSQLEESLGEPSLIERRRENAVPRIEEEEVIEIDERTPAGLIEAMARVCSLPVDEVRGILQAPLDGQLDILTEGALDRAVFEKIDDGKAEDWVFKGAQCDGVTMMDLDAEEQTIVLTAFRIALLEALGPDRGLGIFIGPDLRSHEDGDHLLARSLRRLGESVQVVQFAGNDPCWSEHASSTIELD
ncbi:MAG: hypothetical protein GY725_10505 [bacterium]|nr:hypothetical protein [bacterium]